VLHSIALLDSPPPVQSDAGALVLPWSASVVPPHAPSSPPPPSWADLPPPPEDPDAPIVLADLWRLDPLLAAKVDAEAEDGCWYWTGAVVLAGQSRRVPYGKVWRSRRGGCLLVHRYVHELAIGPIPEGYEVHHTCTVRHRRTLCCNPRHLWALHPDDHDRIQREMESYVAAA